MGTTLHFRNALVYMGSSAAGAAIAITEAAEVNIDVDFDEVADPAFGDTWETRLKGLLRFSGSMGGNFDSAGEGSHLFSASTAAGAVKFYMYPDRATATNYYYGNIFPKLSIRGSVSDKGTFTGPFSGDGELAKKP